MGLLISRKIRWRSIKILAGNSALSLLLFTGNVDATTWNVDDSGRANYARIQDAIESVNAGALSNYSFLRKIYGHT